MKDCPQDLLAEAEKVLPHVYAPYSNFPVATSIRTTSGKIFSGVNVENVSFSLTCCAEKNAISSMAITGEREVAEVLVLVPGPKLCPPCGACRQILLEFAVKNCPVHLCTQSGEHVCYTMEQLLPLTFNTEHL
jgi:cytidine deaminase